MSGHRSNWIIIMNIPLPFFMQNASENHDKEKQTLAWNGYYFLTGAMLSTVRDAKITCMLTKRKYVTYGLSRWRVTFSYSAENRHLIIYIVLLDNWCNFFLYNNYFLFDSNIELLGFNIRVVFGKLVLNSIM